MSLTELTNRKEKMKNICSDFVTFNNFSAELIKKTATQPARINVDVLQLSFLTKNKSYADNFVIVNSEFIEIMNIIADENCKNIDGIIHAFNSELCRIISGHINGRVNPRVLLICGVFHECIDIDSMTKLEVIDAQLYENSVIKFTNSRVKTINVRKNPGVNVTYDIPDGVEINYVE